MKDIIPTTFNFNDKIRNIEIIVKNLLNKTNSMFEYNNLPNTIPKYILELFLQTNGHCIFYKHNDIPYIFIGSLGGEPDQYYRPTIYTISNPYLNITENLKINEDCVIIKNDTMIQGLKPILYKYATLIVENEISLNIATINSRITSLISSDDTRTTESAKLYLKNIADGKLGIIGETPLLNGIKTQPYATNGNSNILINLIEYEQYLKGSLYNELGLKAAFNMKRESLNTDETNINNSILLPLIDDMYNCRKEAVNLINTKYGYNIEVYKNSSWGEIENADTYI